MVIFVSKTSSVFLECCILHLVGHFCFKVKIRFSIVPYRISLLISLTNSKSAFWHFWTNLFRSPSPLFDSAVLDLIADFSCKFQIRFSTVLITSLAKSWFAFGKYCTLQLHGPFFYNFSAQYEFVRSKTTSCIIDLSDCAVLESVQTADRIDRQNVEQKFEARAWVFSKFTLAMCALASWFLRTGTDSHAKCLDSFSHQQAGLALHLSRIVAFVALLPLFFFIFWDDLWTCPLNGWCLAALKKCLVTGVGGLI